MHWIVMSSGIKPQVGNFVADSHAATRVRVMMSSHTQTSACVLFGNYQLIRVCDEKPLQVAARQIFKYVQLLRHKSYVMKRVDGLNSSHVF